jgi:hypothetical protein
VKLLNWRRADLIHWGEYTETKIGRFRKRWVFTDRATNEDGCLFYFSGTDGIEHGPFFEDRDVDIAIHALIQRIK